MKLVVAIVRPEKINEVLEALFKAEVRGLSISRVQGHGGETDEVQTYRGTTVKMELHEKVRLEIGVSDSFVGPTVRAIMSAARTRRSGDGKIFCPAGREGIPDPHRRGGHCRRHPGLVVLGANCPILEKSLARPQTRGGYWFCMSLCHLFLRIMSSEDGYISGTSPLHPLRRFHLCRLWGSILTRCSR